MNYHMSFHDFLKHIKMELVSSSHKSERALPNDFVVSAAALWFDADSEQRKLWVKDMGYPKTNRIQPNQPK